MYTLLVGLVLAAGGASAGYARQRMAAVTPATVAPLLAERLAADSTAGVLHPGVHDVYAARAGQPAWFARADRDAALDLLARADRDALPLDSSLAGLRALSDTARVPASLADADLAVTDALLRFGDALARPRADATELYGIHWTASPPEPPDVAVRLADAFASAPSPAAALALWADGLRPQHPGYRRLRAALARELDLEDRPELVLGRDLAPGDSGLAVVRLRDRLGIETDLSEAEAPAQFDAALGDALRRLQRARGLRATGRLDGPTRDVLNVRRPELIPLLALNLERWRWLPADLGDLHVWVNVPRFELAVRERAPGAGPSDDWAEATRFVTVVGARDWQTPAFTDTLETIVFNPTWIVPASIQRESYGYVKGFVERGPGPGNAMGRVKFLFPNDHAVYVHDTPTKWAFGVDDRARSHGCVRAGDPEALARALLPRTNGWTEEQVSDIFNGSWWPTQWVQVEKTVPVHLVYFTAEVDPNGRLRVYDDVYGRDGRLADALGLERPDQGGSVLATLIADSIGDEEVPETEDEADESETADLPADSAEAAPVAPRDTARRPLPARPAAPSDTADTTAAGVLSRPGRR
ncbi:L,D-transpeptidase family protein [Rubrivirga marina]|uniref:L,D-TPase catalytic domain-containing protein n=1 Tax=Rubrivirga marina TaxID=1196024 RepID=A0A271IZS3_9BACT|nr:L,D-transpeptidase family protein [Rubrivirga marina]PAP76630.1 hypothetical protein BSZ37_09335 [Rubrivirga marina]